MRMGSAWLSYSFAKSAMAITLASPSFSKFTEGCITIPCLRSFLNQ